MSLTNYITRALGGDSELTPKMRAFAARTAKRRERAAEAIQTAQGIAGKLAIGPMVSDQPQDPLPTTEAVNKRGVPVTLGSALDQTRRAKVSSTDATPVSRAQQAIAADEDAWDALFAREAAESGPNREVEFATDADVQTARELAVAVSETRGSERYRFLEQLREHVRSTACLANDDQPQRVIRSTPGNWPLFQKAMAARDTWRKQGGLRSGTAFAEMQSILKQLESGERR